MIQNIKSPIECYLLGQDKTRLIMIQNIKRSNRALFIRTKQNKADDDINT